MTNPDVTEITVFLVLFERNKNRDSFTDAVLLVKNLFSYIYRTQLLQFIVCFSEESKSL